MMLLGLIVAPIVFLAVWAWKITVWSLLWTWRLSWWLIAGVLILLAVLVGWLLWRRHRRRHPATTVGTAVVAAGAGAVAGNAVARGVFDKQIQRARELAAAPVARLFPPPAVEDRVA